MLFIHLQLYVGSDIKAAINSRSLSQPVIFLSLDVYKAKKKKKQLVM